MTHPQSTSRSKPLSWLASVIIATACAAAISLFLARNRDDSRARTAPVEAKRIAEMEEQLKRSNAALRRLEQAQLLRTVAAADDATASDAGRVVSAAQAGADEPLGEDEPEETQPAAYPEEREKAFFGAYFGELEEAMSHQRTDRQLAAQLTPLVPGVDSGLVRVIDLSCTEQLCRLEARYDHADRATRDAFIRDLQSAFAPLMSRATIHLPTDDNRLLGYFAKQGASLPRPTTSFATFMRGDEG